MEPSGTKARDAATDVGTLWTVQRLGHRARCALLVRRQDWEVCVLVDGKPLVAERCERGAQAFAVAESLKQRMLRDGWQQVVPRPYLRRVS